MLPFQSFAVSLPAAAALALAGAVSPSAIGALILVFTQFLRSGGREQALARGACYAAGAGLFSFTAGFILFFALNILRQTAESALYLAAGSLVLIAGLIELKDFFWYGRWFSLTLPLRFVKILETRAVGAGTSKGTAFGSGLFLAFLLLPATGTPLLAAALLVSESGVGYQSALFVLACYSLASLLPAFIIAYAASAGLGLKRAEAWRRRHRGSLRLTMGLALIAAGISIIAGAPGGF